MELWIIPHNAGSNPAVVFWWIAEQSECNTPHKTTVNFTQNKFKDFFERVMADMHCVCDNYEKETAQALETAFANAVQIK